MERRRSARLAGGKRRLSDAAAPRGEDKRRRRKARAAQRHPDLHAAPHAAKDDATHAAPNAPPTRAASSRAAKPAAKLAAKVAAAAAAAKTTAAAKATAAAATATTAGGGRGRGRGGSRGGRRGGGGGGGDPPRSPRSPPSPPRHHGVAINNLLGVHRFGGPCSHEVDAGVAYCMRKREQHDRPQVGYLGQQRHLTRTMRATLLDWMFEVGQEFVLRRETLHTALNFVDRYLSKVRNVPKRQLQLVGVTALWIAAKNKEVYAPHAREFAYSTDRAYTTADLVEMEVKMLVALDWVLDPVTVFAWVELYVHELRALAHRRFEDKRQRQQKQQKRRQELEDSASTSTSEGSPDHTQLQLPRIESGEGARRLRTVRRRLVGGGGGGGGGGGNIARVFGHPSAHEEQEEDKAVPPRLWVTEPWHVDNRNDLFWIARVMEVVDAALLDVNALHFLPSTIAATALVQVMSNRESSARCFEEHDIEAVTRYSTHELKGCRDWMEQFAFKLPEGERKKYEKHAKQDHIRRYYPARDWHCLQRHSKASLQNYKTMAPKHDIVVAHAEEWLMETVIDASISVGSASPRHASLASYIETAEEDVSVVPPTPPPDDSDHEASGAEDLEAPGGEDLFADLKSNETL